MLSFFLICLKKSDFKTLTYTYGIVYLFLIIFLITINIRVMIT